MTQTTHTPGWAHIWKTSHIHGWKVSVYLKVNDVYLFYFILYLYIIIYYKYPCYCLFFIIKWWTSIDQLLRGIVLPVLWRHAWGGIVLNVRWIIITTELSITRTATMYTRHLNTGIQWISLMSFFFQI